MKRRTEIVGNVVGLIIILAGLGFAVKYFWWDRSRPEITYASMARAIDEKSYAPTDETTSFDLKKDKVYCCIHFANISNGGNVIGVTWYAENKVVGESKYDSRVDGTGWVRFEVESSSLDKGEYKAEIKLDGVLKKTLFFNIK